MTKICEACKLQENNYAGVHWQQGAPFNSDGPRCRDLKEVSVKSGYKDDVIVTKKLLCGYCRLPKVFRIINQYKYLPQYTTIAKHVARADPEDIADIRVVEDFDTWRTDGKLSVTVAFSIKNRKYILDFYEAGETGYAMFKYAHDSLTARQDAIKLIKWWANALLTRNWE